MVFGIVLWQMALIFQKPLEMQNNTKKMVVNIVLCVATSTLLNISLADLFGVSIFAFSLSISAILYLALTYISVKQ
jgi:peptidoglycan biosynthesis protein MviN/MurJ (putative lipid II flippase)